jgi:predicted GIY-YIG superfamily endonuclease
MKYWIYKITDKEEPLEFYIGSTNRFSSRKSHHKKNVNNKRSKKYWCKLYQYIRWREGFDNFEMSIIEQGECDDRLFIRNKEQEYINELNPTLNSIRVIKL